MATQSIGGQRWPEGTVVSVYLAAGQVSGGAPSGPVAASATVAEGVVTFAGLAENVRYVAYALGVGISFLVAPGGVSGAAGDRARIAALEARVQPGLEVSILDYASSHGVDRGGGSASDSSAGINAATAALSAEATVLAAATGRPAQGRLIFPKGIYLADGLLPAPGVEWMFDQATLAKKSDADGTAGHENLIRATETLRPAVLAGTGTTVNASYFVSGVSSIASWRRGYPISGAGIPAATKVAGVDTVTGIIKLDKPATASATVALTREATYKGNYSHFRMTGGYITANGKSAHGNLVRLLWMDNLVIDGTTWLDYALPYTPAGFLGTWALAVGGDNNRIDARIMGGPNAVHNDGVHHCHGRDCRLVVNGDAGDDLVAIGAMATASLLAEPDPIDGVIADIQGSTTRGYALRVHVEATVTSEVKNIKARVVAKSGINRNGGVYIVDENHPVIGSELISNITADVELDVGSASHDETNAIGVTVWSAKNVTVNGNIKLTDKTAAATGFRLAYIRDADNTKLNVDCNPLALHRAVDAANTRGLKVGGRLVCGAATTDAVILLGTNCLDTEVSAEILDVPNTKTGIAATTGGTTSLTYSGPRITFAAGATTGKGISAASMSKLALRGLADLSGCPEPLDLATARAIPRLIIPDGVSGVSRQSLIASHFDDFMGDLLADEWAGYKGTDGTAAIPVAVATTGGAARLVTGVDAGGTMALNGSRLESVRNLLPSKVGLAFEARVSLDNITNVALFIGLTNQYGSLLSLPFTLLATTLTSNPADACGFLFDTDATVDNWWAVGVDTNVDAVSQDLGVAPVNNTYAVFRVEVSSAGVATFFYNGIKKGTAMVDATGVVVLGPVVAAFSRAAGSRVVDVDYVLTEQHR